MLDIKSKLSGIFIDKFFFSLNSTYPVLKFNFKSKILHVVLAKTPEDIRKTPWNLLLYQTISVILVIFYGNINLSMDLKFNSQMLVTNHINLLALEYSSFEVRSEYYRYHL